VPDHHGTRGNGGKADGRDLSPVVAILSWGHLIKDFLTPNGLSLDDFCNDFRGSWLFAYADALSSAGVKPVIMCVSNSVREVARRTHTATGTEICVLPAPPAFRFLRSHMQTTYERTVADAFGWPRRRALYPLHFLAKEVAPFLSCPVRALAKELRRLGCNTLLCQEYESPLFDVCVALGRLQRVNVFATFQGGDYQNWRVERVTRPLAMRLAAGLVIASRPEAERVRAAYGPQNIALIPNPVDVEIWRPHDRSVARGRLGIAQDARVAAWHGRASLWKKGLDVLVDAWARVSAAADLRANLVLLLVGAGEDAAEIRRRLNKQGAQNVLWIDRYVHDRAEIAGLLAAADVYAFTSRHEGFPLAPVEAMACGLPVVSTDVSGIRDVLELGERSGGVIVPRDDPERFAKELGRLLDDVSLSRRLGRIARARAETLSARSVGAQLRSFLFQEPPRPPAPHSRAGGPPDSVHT
jgi:glycosyltransferase involved in cell wall biosynthesis